MIVHPGQEEKQNGKNMTARRGQLRQDNRDGTIEAAEIAARTIWTGQPGQDSQNRTVWTGRPGRLAWTGEPGKDIDDRITGT